MSDRMRWRYGDTNPVIAAVAAETVVEIGDLLWQDDDQARPAGIFRCPAEHDVAQAAFAAKFLGLAMARSRQGDTAPIRVATTGVFEMDHPPARFQLGDLMGAAVGEGIFQNQAVAKVEQGERAIGRVAKRQPDGLATVLVDIRSTVMTGGVYSR